MKTFYLVGEEIDEMVRKELVWYRRLWRWLFPPKNTLTTKELNKAIRVLEKQFKNT
jgi:hypothetical protein